MRYIIVNDRAAKATHCTFCPAELKEGYVRDFETNLHYCTHFCLEAHIFASQRAGTAISIPIIERR